MSKLVTIFGGSGFIGRYIARRMALKGWRVRVATRRPNEAMFVRPYGTVGQVMPVLCNIRDDVSVAAALHGAEAVINCVGILNETGANSFDAIHVEGSARVARTAAQLGIGQLVHISAIGADKASNSDYASTKAQGEAAVLEQMPNAIILRPSVVFGAEDGFFNRFAAMTRLGPILPLVSAETQFQPVYVDDLAKAATQCLLGEVAPGVYELGGPETASLRDLIGQMLEVIHRDRIVIGMPHWMAWLLAFNFDMLQKMTFGMISNGVLTRDQLRSLAHDNVVSVGTKGFADLGIEPVYMATILPDYLWRFRPSGQYDAIKRSARGLSS